MSDVRGSNRDKEIFETELDRLKDFASIFAAMTCDYDGYNDVDGLKKLIDELTEMVVETIINGRSTYMSHEDAAFEQSVVKACEGCLLVDDCCSKEDK